VAPLRIKSVVVFLVIGVLFLNLSIPTFAKISPNESSNLAAVKSIIIPQWTNTNDVKLNLYFANGKAECAGIINGISGTSNISATFKKVPLHISAASGH